MTSEETIQKLLPLLPNEGQQSKRAFALFCAERVKHLNADPRVEECLAVVRRKVANPESVTNAELKRASAASSAYAAASSAVSAAASAVSAAASASSAAAFASSAFAYAYAAAASAYAYAYAYAAERKAQADWLVANSG